MIKQIILLITVFFISSLEGQELLDKSISIEQMFLFKGNTFSESVLTNRAYDSIPSLVYSQISLHTLKGYPSKKGRNGYKIFITSLTEAMIYFNFDSVIGIIQRVKIDSSTWYGKVRCFDKKNKKELFSYTNNVLLGNRNSILLFTNNTPTFRIRAPVEKIEDVTRVKILDDSLNFKELLFLGVNFKEPTTTVMISYNEKQKCDFVNTYVVNIDFIGSFLRRSIGEVLAMYDEYVDSRSFTLQYPVSFFRLVNYDKFKHRLNRKVLWLYHEDFFLNPFSPLSCCDQ